MPTLARFELEAHERIKRGEGLTVDDYLSFLKAGGSTYPLDALRMAGADPTEPAAVEVAFDVLSGLADRLEELVG